MKYFLYVSVIVVFGLYTDILHASEGRDESKGQLVLIVGRAKDAVLADKGRLLSCSFVSQNMDDSVGRSLMQIERDVDSPMFLVLKKGSRAHISISTDEQGVTHIHERTTEIEGLKKQLSKIRNRKAQSEKNAKKAEQELRDLQKESEELKDLAKLFALGTGIGCTSLALITWLCSRNKTTPPVCCN